MGLVDTIPSVVGYSGALATQSYKHADREYDYAINGTGFLSAVNDNLPALRKSAPRRKTGLDGAPASGESDLDFWWIKGQITFHGGAGQLYIDTPLSQGHEIRTLRYQNSVGVDVWTQGKATLLKDTVLAGGLTSSATSRVVAISVSGGTYLIYADGTSIRQVQETVAGTTYTVSTVNATFTGNVQGITTDGRFWYATDGDTVQKGDPLAPGTAATVLYTGMGGGTATLGFAKLMLVLGFTSSTTSAVYTLSTTASSAALPVATFTHATPSFVWTSYAEGPGAFYMGGYAGYKGTVYKFVLNTSTLTPTISSGIVVADMPPGETVLAMCGYLNAVVGIVTNRGVRVGQFVGGSTTGDFQIGPLSVTFPTPITSADICGADRFLFASYRDTSGLSGVADAASLVRVDLSQQLNVRPFSYQPDARFAWAPDLRAYNGGFQAGTPTGVTALGDGRKCFVVPGKGLFVEHPTNYTASGSLTTSRIRFDTLDPKIAKFVRARGGGTAGTLTVAVNQDADSGGLSVISQNLVSGQDTNDVALAGSQFTFLTVTVTFAPDATATVTPQLLGYQVKALPAQKKQVFIQVPLLCYDQELDDTGQKFGYDGYARERLLALEALDAAGELVTFQVVSSWADNEYAVLCVIDDLQFIQTSNPNDEQGWGGIIKLTLRTVSR